MTLALSWHNQVFNNRTSSEVNVGESLPGSLKADEHSLMTMAMMVVRSGQTKASLATQSGGVSRRRAPRSTEYQVRPWDKLCRRPGHPSAKGADSTSVHCRMSNSRLHARSFPQSALLVPTAKYEYEAEDRTDSLEGVSWHRATGEPLGHALVMRDYGIIHRRYVWRSPAGWGFAAGGLMQ